MLDGNCLDYISKVVEIKDSLTFIVKLKFARSQMSVNSIVILMNAIAPPSIREAMQYFLDKHYRLAMKSLRALDQTF